MACKNSAFFVEWKARKSEVLGSMFKKKKDSGFFLGSRLQQKKKLQFSFQDRVYNWLSFVLYLPKRCFRQQSS